MKQIFSYGGGTQSIAICALIIQGKIPKPDLAVIADTGMERSTTFKYLEEVVQPELSKIGLSVHVVTRKEWSPKWGAGEFATSGDLLMPAFTDLCGDISKLPAFCSKSWKEKAIDRWLSQTHSITRSRYVKWIGFSLDEAARAMRMMNGPDYKKGLIRFPLIDDVPLRRRDSISIVEKMGWPTPPRSNCWCCPNQSDHEWRDLKKNYPKEFQMACELEAEIQKKDPNAWFHKSCKPLSTVKFNEPESLFSRACDSGNCFI